MHSPATTATATPTTTPVTTTATSSDQHEHNNAPDRLTTKQASALTKDFHLDTFFNPVWMSGPNVFSFAGDGTVVRPEVYAPEPYPGYYTEHTWRVESVTASHFHGFWRSVAITEQDDAEFQALQESVRVRALEEWRRNLPCGSATAPSSTPEEPELVYTWPPKQNEG